MKLKIQNGILVIDILSIILILCIVFVPSTIARVILGLPFILFFPGYTLVATLFSKNEEMNNIELLALSVGMSLAVVALIALGLNYTIWGIKLDSVLYCLSAFIFVTSTIALIRRARILKTNRFIKEINLSLPSWAHNTFNRSLLIILVLAIVVTIGTLAYTVAKPKIAEKFSEFYIHGINGQAQNYPTEYVLQNGQITQVIYDDGTVDAISGFGKVTLGIVNHEQQTAVYTVKIIINGVPVNIYFGGTITQQLGPIELQQGETWEKEIGIIPDHTGDSQEVELLLFNGIDNTSEDSLILWINVKQ